MANAAQNNRYRNRKRQTKRQYDLKLCGPYLYQQDGCQKDENACNFLHICRNYMLGNCKARGKCLFSHDLQSRQVRDLLQRRFGIQPLEGEALQTFRELFAATLVKPTVDESLGEEEAQSKIAKMKQKNQEELQKYLRSCSRRSSLPSSQRKPSTSDANPLAEAEQKPTIQSPRESQPLICSFYLKGSCKFTEEMYKHRNYKHCSKPYQWQIKERMSEDWLDLTEEYNDLVEKKYCNEKCHQYSGKIIAQSGSKDTSFAESLKITFSGDALDATDQQGWELSIRRLSTASYTVAKPWQMTSCTHWAWYMYRNNGYQNIWCEFEEKAAPEVNEDTDITSLILEKFYLNFKNKGGPSVFERSVLQNTWHIDFNLMKCWINLTEQHKFGPWGIARRPRRHTPRDRVVRPKEVPLQQRMSLPAKSVEEPSSSRPTSSPDIPSLLSLSKPAPKPAPAHNLTECVLICPYFLRGRCKYDDDKYKHRRHFKSPYQWQYMDENTTGADWQDFSRNENDSIEKLFCDASVSLYTFQSASLLCCTIRFDDNPMKCAQTGFRFRRLTTSSSVLKSNWERAFCMEWLWYWCDEKGDWNLYSDEGAKGTRATTDSASIEEQFLEFERGKQNESVMGFTAGEQEYQLDFIAMHQTNVRYRTVRPVRRRPKFVPMSERKQISQELSRAPSSGVAMPGTWDNRGIQSDKMKLVLINDTTTSEYRDITALFEKTIDNKGSLVSVERIQNLELWEDFTKKRERMNNNNKGKLVKEMRLFHGTSTKREVDAICHQNFDWRLSGTNVGAIYGKGSYFARDASFAHSYTQPDSLRNRYVIVAQVLVGTYTTGDPCYTRPPPKDSRNPYGDLYDSCVNSMLDPKIYVIFDRAQVYPEYVITYKERAKLNSTATATAKSSSTSQRVSYRTPAQAKRVTPQASTYTYTSAYANTTSARPPTQPTRTSSSQPNVSASPSSNTQPFPSPSTYTFTSYANTTPAKPPTQPASASSSQPRPSYPSYSPQTPTRAKDKGCTIQ